MPDDVPVFNVFPDTLDEAMRRLVAGAYHLRCSELLVRVRLVGEALERGDSQAAALAMFHATTLYEALRHGRMAVKKLRQDAKRRRAASAGGKEKSAADAQRHRDLIKGVREYRDKHPGSNARQVARFLAGRPGQRLAERTIYHLIGPALRE